MDYIKDIFHKNENENISKVYDKEMPNTKRNMLWKLRLFKLMEHIHS